MDLTIMTIIAIATSKGGTGKTMLAAGLAAFWATAGKRVLALDTDPNRHLFDQLEGSGIDCRPVAEDAILAEATRGREAADVVLVDVAGLLAKGMVYAAAAADVVLIPCRPDRADIGEAARTQDVVRNAEAMSRRPIPHAAILTQVNPRTQVLAVARDELDRLEIPRLPAEMPMRVAYAEANFTGRHLDSSAIYADLREISEAIMLTVAHR
ncbi:ParA family protein [Azospirillum sp. 11R-A]|uniref:ParA family protein n=1 Tax=Azospirillum sp. 11R-A TaxID=3111634 RepID=UPI003C1DEC59